jgi:hypothetical protein
VFWLFSASILVIFTHLDITLPTSLSQLALGFSIATVFAWGLYWYEGAFLYPHLVSEFSAIDWLVVNFSVRLIFFINALGGSHSLGHSSRKLCTSSVGHE